MTDTQPGGWTDASAPLVISSYTLGTTVPFEERVQIAAQAGFAGIGLRAENYWDARAAGLNDAAIQALLDLQGLAVMEVEYLTGWGTEHGRDDEQQRKERCVFHLARTFGVRHLNAGLLEQLPAEEICASFAGLCERAGELTVALEFMPYSGVPDLAAAWQVVSASGAANSALIVDAWHWCRSGTTAADLAGIPADRIVSVQLCDVLETPLEPQRGSEKVAQTRRILRSTGPSPSRVALRRESLGHRLPPGQGSGDVGGMLRALLTAGADPAVVTVEVISDELLTQGLPAAARTAFTAARDLLATLR